MEATAALALVSVTFVTFIVGRRRHRREPVSILPGSRRKLPVDDAVRNGTRAAWKRLGDADFKELFR